jgi:hypothetical protein
MAGKGLWDCAVQQQGVNEALQGSSSHLSGGERTRVEAMALGFKRGSLFSTSGYHLIPEASARCFLHWPKRGPSVGPWRRTHKDSAETGVRGSNKHPEDSQRDRDIMSSMKGMISSIIVES